MMGTYVTISLEKDQMDHSKAVFKRLKKVEMALSSYDPQAEIYRLNHTHETEISQDTYEALQLSSHYYKQTNGYFDITIGSITKGLFHFGEEERIPTPKELLEAKVDFKGLHFTREQAWTDEGVKIDLGGMGKGFGVDKAVALLKEQGVLRGVVALSGDIFCLHACEMRIQDPFSDGTLARFSMAQNNTAISTSGNYRRYVQNSDYNHLINPKTRASQKTFSSVTLISDRYSNSDLDAYATAASVMPKHEAFAFLNAFRGLGYLVVSNDKKIVMNGDFKTLTKGLEIAVIDASSRLKPLLYLP
jgi:thiamine biosynthesis lipoprotein